MDNLKLILGDSILELAKLPDNSIDFCITDPPYNFEHLGGGFYSKKSNIKPRKYLNKLEKLNSTSFNPNLFLAQAKRLLKTINMVICTNKSLIKDYINFAIENKCSYDFHVIYKANPIPARENHYLSDLEYVVVIRSAGNYFNKELDCSIYSKVYKVICKPRHYHPAEKDLAWAKKYIEIHSQKGDVILDPYMGSGTIGVACQQLDRQFIGIEINEHYFKVAEERINNYQGVLI